MGNAVSSTTHNYNSLLATLLHPSVRRVDVAEEGVELAKFAVIYM
jgi:hypothetical protein